VTLRTVETYFSYQGEGPNTSKPTLFVRFAGCNFKCPGWPCDTQHAIQPSIFTKTQQHWSPAGLADHILSFEANNICLTGGEVFLQNNEELARCLGGVLSYDSLTHIECFTNGGLDWGKDLPLIIKSFIVDWKLPGSGEDYGAGVTLRNNLDKLSDDDAIKFTIKDRADYEEAKRRYHDHEHLFITQGVPVYAGVVWGALKEEELAKWMMEDQLDWNLNVQTHKFIWHPDKQGV
jgi:7-carboxy-7-deazaguanine synthase